MISCPNLIPTDIRRLLFLSLKATLADTKLDAFDAIAAFMYLEGDLGIDEDDDFPFQQMALELRLNVSAFYRRCLRYPFTSPTLTKWAILVVQEYHYLVNNNSVAQMGMSNFNALPSFPIDRRAWSENFNLLALRLTNTDILGPKPPLWGQLLFAKQDPPVFIAPVYGCIYQHSKQLSRAFPLVPSLLAVRSFYGTSTSLQDLPISFTVVPILALETSTFAPLSYHGGDVSSVDPCQVLVDFDAKVKRICLPFIARKYYRSTVV